MILISGLIAGESLLGVAIALLSNSAIAGCPAAATIMSTQFDSDVDDKERLYWLRKAST